MNKVFELKCFVSSLGNYNATEIYTVYIVCDDAQKAIKSVLTPETLTVEVVSVHPCLILD